MFLVYVVLCLIVFGCQYRCNWLPGKTHLRYDLLCVEWDVKPYTLTPKQWIVEVNCFVWPLLRNLCCVSVRMLFMRSTYGWTLQYMSQNFASNTRQWKWYILIILKCLSALQFLRHRYMICNVCKQTELMANHCLSHRGCRVNPRCTQQMLWAGPYLLRLGLDRYRYRVSADTCQYRWVSVLADTYFSIGADTSSSFACLCSQQSTLLHARL